MLRGNRFAKCDFRNNFLSLVHLADFINKAMHSKTNIKLKSIQKSISWLFGLIKFYCFITLRNYINLNFWISMYPEPSFFSSFGAYNGVLFIGIIFLVTQVSGQYQSSSCFATQQIVLWSNSSSINRYPTTPQTDGYPFTFTWSDTFPNLTSSSYALSGVKLADLNLPFSFTASLVANPTGGTFFFILFAGSSSVLYAAFSIMLVSKCNSGSLYLQKFTHMPTIFNNSPRTTQYEDFDIMTKFPYSNPKDFIIQVFISSYRCTSFSNVQQVWTTIAAQQPGKITFRITSYASFLNTLIEVTVTYIAVQVSTFNSKLLSYDKIITQAILFNITRFATNFGIPQIFNLNLTRKFIIGFAQTAFFNLRPLQIYFADSGSIASANIYQLINNNTYVVDYSIFGIMQCDIYNLVDSRTAPTMCRPCSEIMQHCLSCSSPTKCTACSVGWPVAGGCTNVTGCVSIANVKGSSVCTFCNAIKKYIIFNSMCQCASGFQVAFDGQCAQVCGDGRLFNDQCDDGNTNNGDGCSSVCKQQSHFICLHGSPTHKSECVYVRYDFKLTPKYIDKTDGQNQGIFAFKVYPPFPTLDKLNLSSNLQFNCDNKGQFTSWAHRSGVLVLTVDYHQNLEGSLANVTITFNSTFILQNPYTILFTMISNGDKLIVVKDYAKCALLINLMTVISFAVLFLFLVGSLSHKMIGVEILNAFQTISLLQALSSNCTPVFGLIKNISFVAGNFLFFSNSQAHIYNSKSYIDYSSTNSEFFQAVAVGLGLFLSFCCALPLLWKWTRATDENTEINTKRFDKIDSFVRVVYTYLLFPTTVGFLVVNLLTVIDNQTVAVSSHPSQIRSVLSVLSVLIQSFIFFFEAKLLFVKKNRWNFQDLSRCADVYIPIYLIYLLFLTLIIVVSNHQSFAYSIEVVAGIVFLLFVYLLIKRPYLSCLHNIGQIINVSMVLYFVGWMIVREYFVEMTSEENEIFCMFLLCGFMAACLMISSARIVAEVRGKLKNSESLQLTQKQSQKINKTDGPLLRLRRQKQEIQKILHSLNPFYREVVRQKQRIQEKFRTDQERLIMNVDIIYNKSEIQEKMKELSKKYQRNNEFDELKSSLKDCLQDKLVRQELNE